MTELQVNLVTAAYLGNGRVQMVAGNRVFDADQRLRIDQPEAGFCPLELVAAALGA